MLDFALFILSHNRAENIDALDLLQRSNYDGMWYVVISTDNKEIEKYKSIVPQEHLLIFDKMKVECDTMLSRRNFKPNAAIYARNFIIDYAKDKYIYFGMMDDDISNIFFRMDDKGKMKKICACNCFNEIIEALISFISSSKTVGGVGLASDRKYFGGVPSIHQYEREMFQFVIIKSSDVRRYKGVNVEDCVLSCSNFDKVYYTYRGVCVLSPSPGSNKGGVEYDIKMPHHFFWLMACPSAIKITPNGGRKRTNKYMYPQIINEKYKKL